MWLPGYQGSKFTWALLSVSEVTAWVPYPLCRLTQEQGLHVDANHNQTTFLTAKARERWNIPVVQKTLESWCFLEGQRAGMSIPSRGVHTPVRVRDARPTGWLTRTANAGERARLHSGFWSGGDQSWGPSRKQRCSRSSEEKGKGPCSGRTVCRTRQRSAGAHLHLEALTLGGYPTEIPTQFFKDVFSILLIRERMI